MADGTQSDSKRLHSTIRHQLKVSKLHSITNEDMVKLDYFRCRVFALGDKHRQLWGKYHFVNISRYDDPLIRERYGDVAAAEMYELYNQWIELRREMEQFLEMKNLP